MSPLLLILIFFVSLLILIFLGYPIGFTLGGLSVLLALILVGPNIFPLFISRINSLIFNFVLIAIPLFIFMGVMLGEAGISEELYNGMHLMMGPVRGGLAVGTVVICVLLAATTGIIGASIAAVGVLAVPAMLKRHYQKELTLGTVAASGTLGILIPPSIMLVAYGGLMANVSVGKLFLGAFIPGLLMAGLYVIYILIRTGFRPDLGPPMPKSERDEVSLNRKLWIILTAVSPPIFLILLVLGSIFAGIATPTEAAAMGSIGSVILAAVKGKLSWPTFQKVCYSSARITAMVCLLFTGATCFVVTFTAVGGDTAIEELFEGLGLGRWGVLFSILLIIIILGCFIDWMGILVMNTSIFWPLIADLGFDPLWYALLVCVTLQTSFLTPPFGGAIFYLKGVSPPEVSMADILRGILPFLVLQLIAIALCIIFPQIVTWLPSLAL